MFAGSCRFIFYLMQGLIRWDLTTRCRQWSWNFQSFKASYRLHLITYLTRADRSSEQKMCFDKTGGITQNFSCQTHISSRVYNNIRPTQDELNYPVAYSIVVHANFGQVERLIRAIWRPQERSSTRLATVTFRIRYGAYHMPHMSCRIWYAKGNQYVVKVTLIIRAIGAVI